jgi:hypothetical protein
MADLVASPKPSTAPSSGIRRSLTGDEPSHFRHRASTNRFANDTPSPLRRRSSNLTDFSLEDARRSIRSSTDGFLLPRPSGSDANHGAEPSHWHSAPLAFALLPALGGLFFKNGSQVVTDVMLLGLAAVFLNWSVRLPWYVNMKRVSNLYF